MSNQNKHISNHSSATLPNASPNTLLVESLSVTLAKTDILTDISLSLQQGEIGCLLGPSGCGKTTLLRSIAGFITPQSGTISLSGKTVSTAKSVVVVEKRNVGMVFQDFALFPHLSVFDNIAFGLKHLGHSKSDIGKRVQVLLELIDLADKADSYPHQLSGGQQQRIALARALAPKPSIILLDEPFSSIDQAMRDTLAFKVREILKKEQATAIMVTHDQAEAYAIADKIGVMNAGRLLQWDSATQVYQNPTDKFVAQFIGESHFVEAVVTANNLIDTPLGSQQLTKQTLANPNLAGVTKVGHTLSLLVRPDNIVLDDTSPIQAKILHRFFKGATFLYMLELTNGKTLMANFHTANTKQSLAIGSVVNIRGQFATLLLF